MEYSIYFDVFRFSVSHIVGSLECFCQCFASSAATMVSKSLDGKEIVIKKSPTPKKTKTSNKNIVENVNENQNIANLENVDNL